jgi:hypothetical protein
MSSGVLEYLTLAACDIDDEENRRLWFRRFLSSSGGYSHNGFVDYLMRFHLYQKEEAEKEVGCWERMFAADPFDCP